MEKIIDSIKNKNKDKLKIPKQYCVIMHNDDYTTQEFVIHVLKLFFYQSGEKAFAIMLKIHREGKAKIGAFSKDVAESKAAYTMAYAKEHGMPLLLTAEEI